MENGDAPEWNIVSFVKMICSVIGLYLGLKIGVSRAAHTQYAYIRKYPPPPGGGGGGVKTQHSHAKCL